MSKSKRKAKAAEAAAESRVIWRGREITPDSFEGAGMEDLDAALLEPPEPAPDSFPLSGEREEVQALDTFAERPTPKTSTGS